MKKKITALIIGFLFAITSSGLCLAQSDTNAEPAPQNTPNNAASAGIAADTADGSGVAAAGTGINLPVTIVTAAVVALVAYATSSSSSTTVQH